MVAYVAAQAAFSAHGCRPMMHIVSRARFSFSSTTPLHGHLAIKLKCKKLTRHQLNKSQPLLTQASKATLWLQKLR